MTDGAIVSLRGVHFSYSGEPVLTAVDLTVEEGESVAVIGPNGGGKTTLLKLILGLLAPSSGSVRVFGGDPAAARGLIGYVPQHVSARQTFPIDSEGVVLMGLCCGGARRFGYAPEERQRAHDALARVGGLKYAHEQYGSLSGGQRQRVLIARAIVSEPKLLLFDEPTANIDPHGRFCLYELLKDLARSTTILSVSHDMAITSAAATRVACVNRSLAASPDATVTEAMYNLMYGSHDRSCPMGSYLQALGKGGGHA